MQLPHVEPEDLTGSVGGDGSHDHDRPRPDWTRLAILAILAISLILQVGHLISQLRQHKDWMINIGNFVQLIRERASQSVDSRDMPLERPRPENILDQEKAPRPRGPRPTDLYSSRERGLAASDVTASRYTTMNGMSLPFSSFRTR